MINVYDFDNTIYNGDSTLDFYFYCLKKNPKIIFLIFIQIFGFIMYKLHIKNKEFFKEKFFVFLNKFNNIDKLVNDFWNKKEKNIKKWYLNQKKDSDVIISASPEFLLKPICNKLKVNLIASDVDKKNGKFKTKNCYGKEKVNRFKKECNKKIDSFYCDSKSDRYIAKYAKKAYLVKGNFIKEWDLEYNKEIKKYLILYIILFCLLFYFCIEMYFSHYNKTYFRSYDGLDQHFLIFTYIGDLIRGLFTGKGFVMWNNGIGYGGDVLTSLTAYLYDPFNWIAVFFKESNCEFGFGLMIFLKMFMTGLSFGLYGIYKKYDYKKILTGSIIYTFSATAYIVFIQSFFINPMYIFPIVIIGCDKLLKEDNPLVYILSLAFAFINYFYFAYMICIFIFFYCLIHFIFDDEIETSIKSAFKICIKFILYSILAVGISSVVLLPVLKALLSIDRLDIKYYLPMFYDKGYYAGVLKGFTNYYYMSSRDSIIGYGPICLPCIILLFLINKKEYIKYKVVFILLVIILIFPFLGSVFNGFSYYANRWIWCLAFLVSDIVCLMRNEFNDSKKIVITEIIIICYQLLLKYCFDFSETEFVLGIVFSIVIISMLYIFRNKKIYNTVYLVSTISAVLLLSYCFSDSSYNFVSKENVIRGEAYDRINNLSGQELLKNINETDPYRYQMKGMAITNNSSWIYKRSGIENYISIYNNDISIFNDEIGLITEPIPMKYKGINDRSELSYLLGVKYYINRQDYKSLNPYGYNKIIDSKKYKLYKYNIYSPSKDVGLVYGFNNTINRKDYEELDAYNKEKVLMESIVLENEKTNFEYKNYDEVNYKMELSKSITKDNKEYVLNDIGNIDLLFNSIKDSEVYLLINGINFEYLDKFDAIIGIEFYNDEEIVERTTKYFNNNRSHMFGNKKNYLFNSGYKKGPINRIKITLNTGDYVINDIKVYKRSKNEIESTINNLNNITKDIKYYNNRFDIDLDVDKDEYAFISIPYSNGGWKAYLDNKEVEIIKTDTAFMSIKVNKGKHKLILKYKTPLLYEGLTITIISIIILLVVIKKRRIFL